MPRSVYFAALIAIQFASAIRSTNTTKRRNLKSIVFFRHGKSIGNWAGEHPVAAGFKYHVSTVHEISDGALHEEGEKQVVDRVKSMETSDVERIIDAEIVLVSPLKRAMATAVILLAEAYNQSGIVANKDGKINVKWPIVAVVPTLREKVGSRSDVPESGDDTLTYIGEIATKYSLKLFGNGSALDPLKVAIGESFSAERDKTKKWTNPEPKTEIQLMKMIDEFKNQVLSELEQDKILAVGHGTWSRTAFSAFMPSGGSHEDKALNLINGKRRMMILNNVGMLRADFDPNKKIFTSVEVDPVKPGTGDFPNCAYKKGSKDGLFDLSQPKFKEVSLNSLQEALLGSVVPLDSTFERVEVLMVKPSRANRVITLSQSSETGVRVAWMAGHKMVHRKVCKDQSGQSSFRVETNYLVFRYPPSSDSNELIIASRLLSPLSKHVAKFVKDHQKRCWTMDTKRHKTYGLDY